MTVVGEFFRDPIGWTAQFGRLFVDEVKDQKAAKKIGSVAVDVIESAPFDSGLILTQGLSDPLQFGGLFVDEFPREQARVLRKTKAILTNNPANTLLSRVAVIVVVIALFPTIFAVARRVGKVIA